MAAPAVLEVSTQSKTLLNHDDSKDEDVMSNNSYSYDGSVVASPSVGSFSTFADAEVSQFGSVDTRDLQVRVDNPQKHVDTLETYITFRVQTRTSRAEFDETEYTVRRRYNDFAWLRSKLVATFPTHLVPPLPGKHSILAQLDRYSKEFIIARMSLLHRFLNRVANHPILSCDQHAKLFLTAKPSEFAIQRRQKSSLLSRLSVSLHDVAASLAPRKPAPEFDAARKYATQLGSKLQAFLGTAQRIQQERQGYLQELRQLHPCLTLWSGSEPELSALLVATATAVEAVAAAEAAAVAAQPAALAQPMQELLLYVDAVQEAAVRRDAVQIEFELTVEELEKRRREKDALAVPEGAGSGPFGLGTSFWKGQGENRDDKLQALAQVIPKLVKQVEENEDKLQCANENLRSDIERWHAERRADLKQLFLALANAQISCLQQSLSAWEEVLPIAVNKPTS